jgi:hypothetical protein
MMGGGGIVATYLQGWFLAVRSLQHFRSGNGRQAQRAACGLRFAHVLGAGSLRVTRK